MRPKAFQLQVTSINLASWNFNVHFVFSFLSHKGNISISIQTKRLKSSHILTGVGIQGRELNYVTVFSLNSTRTAHWALLENWSISLASFLIYPKWLHIQQLHPTSHTGNTKTCTVFSCFYLLDLLALSLFERVTFTLLFSALSNIRFARLLNVRIANNIPRMKRNTLFETL